MSRCRREHAILIDLILIRAFLVSVILNDIFEIIRKRSLVSFFLFLFGSKIFLKPRYCFWAGNDHGGLSTGRWRREGALNFATTSPNALLMHFGTAVGCRAVGGLRLMMGQNLVKTCSTSPLQLASGPPPPGATGAGNVVSPPSFSLAFFSCGLARQLCALPYDGADIRAPGVGSFGIGMRL